VPRPSSSNATNELQVADDCISIHKKVRHENSESLKPIRTVLVVLLLQFARIWNLDIKRINNFCITEIKFDWKSCIDFGTLLTITNILLYITISATSINWDSHRDHDPLS
jgi:hypothetical protein